jgi:ATP-binding cassette subfamily B protein
LIYSFCWGLKFGAIAVVLAALFSGTVSYTTVWLSFGLMLADVIIEAISKDKQVMADCIAGYQVAANKRMEIADRMKAISMGYFNDQKLGYIVSVTTNNCETVQEVGTRIAQTVTDGLLITAVILVFMLIWNWKIGLVAVCGFLAFFLVNAKIQKVSASITSRKVKADLDITDAILEFVQGISVIRSYNLVGTSSRKVQSSIEECTAVNYKMERKFIPWIGLQKFVLKFASFMIILMSIKVYLSGETSLLLSTMFIIAAFGIFQDLELAGGMATLLRLLDRNIDRIQALLEADGMSEGSRTSAPVRHDIKIEDVTFSYEARQVIDHVSFTVPQGTTTALIGPSGCGKTTICNLIARFWDVDGGSISIGGIDVRHYSLDELMEQISMVFQEVYLFNDTIENNIRFGSPQATHEMVIEAARAACCDEFISKLENGYDTVVGEGGATISGGEKQRISIARAILKDAPIVILDEATANVDPENESRLQLAIERLAKDKTLLIIAHRMNTVRNADQIIALKDGMIVQQGTHDQLMKMGGLYADFIMTREKSIGWKLA